MPLGMEVGLSPGDFVLDGDPAPPRKGAPKFSAHLYCGQTAGWMKIPLGMEVRLSPGDFVLDGNPAHPPPLKKGAGPPQIFGPSLLWPNGWMYQDATLYGGKPQSRRLCVRCGPSPLPQKGAQQLPNFRPFSIVAKRLDALRCHLLWI